MGSCLSVSLSVSLSFPSVALVFDLDLDPKDRTNPMVSILAESLNVKLYYFLAFGLF